MQGALFEAGFAISKPLLAAVLGQAGFIKPLMGTSWATQAVIRVWAGLMAEAAWLTYNVRFAQSTDTFIHLGRCCVLT